MLWWTLAGVLAVTGRRRAAVRGLASLLVASGLTNVIAKQVFGGHRPLLADVPIGRRLSKQPLTPSFPSGHSASAAAFAAGVALERPRIGAAIAPVALGVGYSRLHTGAHWLSDVVGGLALGTGVAGVGALVVPPRPGEPELPRRAAIDRSLPASPDGEGVFIVVNRSSGTSVVRSDPLRVIADRLPPRKCTCSTTSRTPATAVREALARADPPRILGVCGGDGSVAAVAHEARIAGLPLLVVPGGTFNHFARTAGAASVDLAIDALQRGEGVRADVAELTFGDDDPITVLNTASVGIYPDFVADARAARDRWGKWLAGVIAAARVLRRSDPVTVVIEGRRARVWTLFVGVGANDPGTAAPLQRPRSTEACSTCACCTRIHVCAPRPRSPSAVARVRCCAASACSPAVSSRSRPSRSTSSCDRGRASRPGSRTTARWRSTRRPRHPRPIRTGLPHQDRIVPAALDVYRPAATGPDAVRQGSD